MQSATAGLDHPMFGGLEAACDLCPANEEDRTHGQAGEGKRQESTDHLVSYVSSRLLKMNRHLSSSLLNHLDPFGSTWIHLILGYIILFHWDPCSASMRILVYIGQKGPDGGCCP